MLKIWFVFALSILSLPTFAKQEFTQVLSIDQSIAKEAYITRKVALIESQCGPVSTSREGKPDVLLPRNYETYCFLHEPVAMFAHLADGRTATIQVCNLENEPAKIYCPEASKFKFDDAIWFSN